MTETEFDLPFDDEIYQKHRALVDLGIGNIKSSELVDYHASVEWIENYDRQLYKIEAKIKRE